MPKTGVRRRRKDGVYRKITILIREDIYEALVLKSIRENASLSDLINSAVEAFLNGNCSTVVHEYSSTEVQQYSSTVVQEDRSTTEPFSDNPWINILRNKGEGG